MKDYQNESKYSNDVKRFISNKPELRIMLNLYSENEKHNEKKMINSIQNIIRDK